MMGPIIRAGTPGDRDAVAALIALSYLDDPELGRMVAGVHRPDAEPPYWRRTVLAELPGAVIGVGTAAASRYHPGTSPANVIVHPAHRREGIGTALLAAVRAAVAGFGTDPLWSTVDTRAPAGLGFAAAAGFTPTISYEVWQVGPGPVPRVDAPVPLTDLSTLDNPAILDAWDELHDWGHERDAVFAARTPRDVVATEMLPRFDRTASHAAYDGGRLLGLCVLADFDGSLAMMAGVRPGVPGGARLATALIAATLPGPARGVRLEVADTDGPVAAALSSFSARREAARTVVRERT